MSETDQADLIPHQRLIINNTTALLSAQALLTQNSSSKCPFSSAQAITSSSAVVDSIFDVEDDFTRELAFYQQCLDAANQARMLLKKEGFLFSRPHDFFAEMVKSDDHMDKIKRKMADEAAAKKASAEAKRQRDLRRFGKQVQIVKGQERDKERRTALNKIETLKRSMYTSCSIFCKAAIGLFTYHVLSTTPVLPNLQFRIQHLFTVLTVISRIPRTSPRQRSDYEP